MRLAPLALLLLSASACKPGEPDVAKTSAEYEAEQLACVDRAATREGADACRDEVKRRYGRLDGGAQ